MCTHYADDESDARMFEKMMFLVRDWDDDDEPLDTLDDLVCWYISKPVDVMLFAHASLQITHIQLLLCVYNI